MVSIAREACVSDSFGHHNHFLSLSLPLVTWMADSSGTHHMSIYSHIPEGSARTIKGDWPLLAKNMIIPVFAATAHFAHMAVFGFLAAGGGWP